MKKHLYLLILSLVYWHITCWGQLSTKETTVSFRAGSSVLDGSFADNDSRLIDLVLYLKDKMTDSTFVVRSVEFRGNASPEGSFNVNRKLSAARMRALESYIRSRVEIPSGIVKHTDMAVDWEYLLSEIEKSEIYYKNEVVDIIRNTPVAAMAADGVHSLRWQLLMQLKKGQVWADMDRRFFEPMRNAAAVVITYKHCPAVVSPDKAEIPQLVVKDNIPPLSFPVVHGVAGDEDNSPFYMALKSNLLFDVCLVPNVGVEYYLGKGWSLGFDWMYAWWHSDKHHRYWRTYGGSMELRRWLQRSLKPLTGHHAGIYVQGLTYDVEFGGTGNLSDFSYGVGLSYGYSLPVGRRLNLDFTLGVGYFGGKYKVYDPIDGHYVWQSTKNRHWFGPTKAEISLVWLIGHGNINDKKGGLK